MSKFNYALLVILVFGTAMGPLNMQKAAAQTITLKYSTDAPGPPNAYEIGHDWFLTQVEKRTNGRVKFERYWSASLNPSREALQALGSGIADMANIVTGYWPGQLELAQVLTLPAVTSDYWVVMKATADLYEEMAPLKEELRRLKIRYLAANGLPESWLISKKQVNNLADLKGMKLRVSGRHGELYRRFGVSPMETTAPEMYEALQRGTVDGIAMNPVGVAIFKLYEPAKNYIKIRTGALGYLMPINLQTWDRLPSDIKKIMEDVGKEHVYHQYHAMILGEYGVNHFLNNVLTPNGVKVLEFPETENLKMKELSSRELWNRWAEEKEAKGLPGKAVLNKWLELVKKWEGKTPAK